MATSRPSEDTSRYIGYLVEQADTGNTKAMSELAGCYRDGTHGVAANLDEALRWYRAARDGDALFWLGRVYYNGSRGNHRDVDKAVSAWAVAADLGHDWSKIWLGWCCQHGVGVECDQQRAVELYAAAIAEWEGHSWCLGVCYLRGEGVKRDWAMAVRLIEQSGNQSDAQGHLGQGYHSDAQAYLGWCYLWGGCGVERDVAKAVELLSAGSGSKAKVFLGYCHERGLGVSLDTNKARQLFNEAGDSETLGELGEYCERGDCGAPTDKRAAVRYYQMGADAGDPVSMFHLGVCLRDGVGVGCNVEQSHHWLAMAAQLGHRGAAKILSSSESRNGENNSAVQKRDLIVETLKRRVEALEQQLFEERAQSKEQFESLKKQVAELEKEKIEEHQAVINLEEFWEDLTKKNDELQKENENLREELQEECTILNTMTSLISANVGDFGVEKLLGTGSNAAVFKVQFKTATPSSTVNASSFPPLTSRGPASDFAATRTATTDMVMKIIFNWENTPQQTLLRRKYMAECVVLSLVPNHPNVIHPLGALVIPCLPAEFVDKIPSDKKYCREELCNNKSLAILMPHCGITLSSFLVSSSSSNMITVQVVQNLFVQGLKAISHIESHFVVHRDIKGDNILVDPETGKLTLIDFGEAQNCPNMEMMVTATSQAWGNTGTMPPELSVFLKRITRGTGAVFSYSKCDSFSLALTFWNALLPPDHKFIGSSMNYDMSKFCTQSLFSHFPVPLFSLTRRAASPRQPVGTTTSPSTSEPVLESVMIRMMNSDKSARTGAADALNTLSSM
ncbi:sel1 repeat family protein [Pelomyxa schiedti]|nr:sel1 repeat family protein [Pelomyxa schiedti]